MNTITCKSFSVTSGPGDRRFRLHLEDPQTDSPEDRMSLAQVSAYTGIGTKTLDKYSRRKRNPIPFHRARCRLFAFRHEVDEWLHSAPLGSRPPPAFSLTRTAYGSPPKQPSTPRTTPE